MCTNACRKKGSQQKHFSPRVLVYTCNERPQKVSEKILVTSGLGREEETGKGMCVKNRFLRCSSLL